jgi:hypothetical protein
LPSQRPEFRWPFLIVVRRPELLGHASQQPALHPAAAVACHDDQIAVVNRFGYAYERRAVRDLGADVQTLVCEALADLGEQCRGTGVELTESLPVDRRVERHNRGDFSRDDAHHVDHADEVNRYTQAFGQGLGRWQGPLREW